MIAKESVFGYTRGERKASTAAPEVCLEVQDLRTEFLRGIDLKANKGELVGIGGLRGQGQRDLLLSLFGDIPYTGSIRLFGKPTGFKHPREAMRQGIALVPGDRAKEGLLYIRSILENLLLPSWGKYGAPLQDRQGQKGRLRGRGEPEPENGRTGGTGQQPLRRQRAEGGHRQMADAQTPAAPAGRPHQGRGCRHEGGVLRAAFAAVRGGQDHPVLQQR